MSEIQPDIEIYLKRPAIDDILGWLEKYFEISGHETSGDRHEIHLNYNGTALTCMIFEKVAKGGYASVWFKSNKTPWSTDEACASDAFESLGLETRCSTGGWQPGTEDGERQGDNRQGDNQQGDNQQGDKGGWYRFTAAGKSTINWLT